MVSTEDLIILLSRVFLAPIYLWAGGAKLLNWKGTVAYMQGKHFPLIPLMLPGAIFLQIGGGLSVLFGFYCPVGAAALILFTIPAMLKMHNFWSETGAARLTEKMFFMKDLAIVGGLLSLLILGPGKISLDALFDLSIKF